MRPAGRNPVLFQPFALPQTFRAAVEEVGFAGRVVYIGHAKKAEEYETKFFVQMELDNMGSRNATPTDLKNLIQLLENKKFPVNEVITKTVLFAEAGAAMKAWSDNPAAFTKIQIAIG